MPMKIYGLLLWEDIDLGDIVICHYSSHLDSNDHDAYMYTSCDYIILKEYGFLL